MAKPGKQQKDRRSEQRRERRGEPRQVRAAGGWLEAAVVLGILVYLVCFYMADPRRSLIFVWLVRPDDLLGEWVGWDLSRFGFLDRVPVLLGALSILGLGYLAGRLVLDLLRADRVLTGLEVTLVSLGAGLNILSLFTLSVGLAGLLRQRLPFVVGVAILLGLALLRARTWLAGQAPVAAEMKGPDDRRPLVRLALVMCVPLAVVILLGGMLPPWHFDVREYHLQVPKEWFQQGRIGFLPHNVYGNMPLGAEMHAVLGMVLLDGWRDWWWGALVGKTVIAAFAPLTALAVYAAGRRFVSPACGAVAAFVFISTPWLAHVSTAGLIEGCYAFYLVLAVHLTFLATGSEAAGPGAGAERPSLGLAGLAGFLAGSAVACKYPALLFLVAPLLVWIALAGPGRFRGPRLAVFVLAVVCACGLWFGKNALLTGNPTYPLLYEWFDGRTRTAEKDEQWTRAHNAPADGLSASALVHSVTMVGLTSDYLSPVLVPLGILGLFSRGQRRLVWSLLAILVFVFAAWWLLTHRVDRFLLPLLPLASLLAALGADWSASTLWRRFVIGLLVWCLVTNLLFVSSRSVGDNRFFVDLAQLRRDMPRAEDPPDPNEPRYYRLHRAQDFLNQAVAEGYQALLVGEAQVFDLEVPVLYNTCFDSCVFEQLTKGRTAAERREVFRRHRISHVLVSWYELDRYRSPGNYGYSDYVTRELIHREFVEQQRLLRPLDVGLNPGNSELFEVVGFGQWEE